MSKNQSATEGAGGQQDQQFFRWPPVGSSISTLADRNRSKLLEEAENLPVAFVSREVRVDHAGWTRYLRQQPEVKLREARHPQLKKHEHETKRRRRGDEEAALPSQHLPKNEWGMPFHPFSRVAVAWQILITLVDATYSAFLIPISCAFHWNIRYFSWYNGIDCAAGVAFWIDIFMGFTTGFVPTYNLKRLIVMQPRLIAEYYIIHGTFIWDLIAALPIIAEVVVVSIPRTGGEVSLHVIFLARLARLTRVFRMVEWLIKVSLAGQINRAINGYLSAGQMFLMSLLYAGSVLLNLLTCFWYYVATWEGLENSWLQSVGSLDANLSDANPVRQWVASLHFVTATVTTVGYGDIAPVSSVEQLMAAAIMLFGVVLFGFVIAGSAELVQYLAPTARTLSILREKMQQVDLWMSNRPVSHKLHTQINSYFTEVWLRHHEFEQNTIFFELPAVLQTEVCYELTNKILSGSEIFKVLDTREKLLLGSRLRPMSICAGHDLCREGDKKADCFWILEEGEVLVIRHGVELELATQHSILGENAVLSETIPTCAIRPYTFRAVSPCMLWRLEQVDMEHVFRMVPGLRERILASFRSHLYHLMEENKHVYDTESWEDVLDHMNSDQIADLDEEGDLGSLNGSVGHLTPSDHPSKSLSAHNDDLGRDSSSTGGGLNRDSSSAGLGRDSSSAGGGLGRDSSAPLMPHPEGRRT